MNINGCLSATTPSHKQYSQQNYGTGWYGANAAKRWIESDRYEFRQPGKDPANVRYSDTLNTPEVSDLLAFSHELITQQGGNPQEGLSSSQFLSLAKLDDSEFLAQVKENAIASGLAFVKDFFEDIAGDLSNEIQVEVQLTDEDLDYLAQHGPEFANNAITRLREQYLQRFEILDRNKNGQLELGEMAAMLYFTDGIGFYLKQADPDFMQKHGISLDTPPDGEITHLENKLTGLYLSQGDKNTLGQILDTITAQLNLQQTAQQFFSQHPSQR